MLNFEDHYTIAIWSWKKLQDEIVYKVLGLPSVRKLLFPARLHIGPKEVLEFEQPEQFDLSLLHKAFVRKDFFMVMLDGINGFELSLKVEKGAIIVPNSFNLLMPLQAVQRKAINWKEVRNVFMEVVPLFQSDQGRVLYHGPGRDERITYGEPKSYRIHITLEWFSYYGPKALEILGRERFDQLVTCREKVPLNGGILIVLQEEPLDMTNPEHVARKHQAEHELGFDELAKDEKRVWRQKPIQVPSTDST